ncbi:MAG: helix-turn-helix domain-containing protein [Phycisphaerales bacterium]|jgi:putative transcriptional regulator|nr:helix-turn-helix domain-containing protein [Phycisphaerales bacterium]
MKSKRIGKSNRATRSLLRSLEDLKACLHDGVQPEDRFPSRTVFAIPAPSAYSITDVVKLRKRLGMSQAGFAELLGVSRILVQGWERGVRIPSPLACRLLDTISQDPAGWLAGLHSNRRAVG